MTEPIHRRTPLPEKVVEQAFGIIHKRALGTAVGTVAAVFVFGLTWFHVLTEPGTSGPNLGLLAEYFYGYSVTPAGAFIGAFWAFVSGFVGGWFLAFVRNFVLAVQIVFIRARSDISASSDILDHI